MKRQHHYFYDQRNIDTIVLNADGFYDDLKYLSNCELHWGRYMLKSINLSRCVRLLARRPQREKSRGKRALTYCHTKCTNDEFGTPSAFNTAVNSSKSSSYHIVIKITILNPIDHIFNMITDVLSLLQLYIETSL